MPERNLTESEQAFFRDFFGQLTAQGIRFVLLRNYSHFPQRIGNDLDVLFERGQTSKALSVLRESLRKISAKVVHIHRRDYFVAVWFQLPNSGGNSIHMDFYHGAFTWHGMPYLEATKAFASQRLFNGLPVPRPAHEALSLFLASLLWGAFFKERYAARIQELLAYQDERSQFESCLRENFGPAGLEAFRCCLENKSSLDVTRSLAERLRSELRRRSLVREPLRTLWRIGRYWLAEVRTVIRPPGLHVLIRGDVQPGQVVESLSALPFGEVWLASVPGKGPTRNGIATIKQAVRIRIRKAKNHLAVSVRGENTSSGLHVFGGPDVVCNFPASAGAGEVQPDLKARLEPAILKRLSDRPGI